jgi:alkanesulfonate monooxygenase SsuD/methylene tetrahydromethanopterin reductase-like flavin-dependent oxidoreductase (luciferase family)
MDVGISLPTNIRHVTGPTVVEWSRRAEAAGFSTLGMGERIGYDGYDWAVALAAAAAVTERVRLLSHICILPLRYPAMAAKQALSVHRLSGGRLSFGTGMGPRREDYDLVGAPFEGRARRFEEALVEVRRVWTGEPPVPGLPPIGPAAAELGPPELIVGGFAPAAIRRAARLADGLSVHDICGDVPVADALFGLMRSEWAEAGREGRPRLIAGFYFCLGPNAREHLEYIHTDYYGDYGADEAWARVTTYEPGPIAEKLAGLAEIGCDEVILTPAVGTVDQVDRLAEAVGLG